jgi:hypothetical protein
MSEYLRRQGRSLQTPQRVYTHPETGRRITLIGMVHVGEPRYFDQVKAVIAECEAAGAVVHSEASPKHLTDDQLLKMTPEEAEVIQEFKRGSHLIKHQVPAFGWIDQTSAFWPWPETWQFIDLSRIDMIRMTGTEKLLRFIRRINDMMDWEDNDSKKPHMYRLSIATTFRLAASNSKRVQRRLEPPVHKVLVDHRNKVAMDAVHATTQDVVLVWGSKHLVGMEADLRDHGYVRVSETWHHVFQLPSVIGSVWGVVRGKPLKPPVA